MKNQFKTHLKPFLMVLIAVNDLEIKNVLKILKIYCGGSWDGDLVYNILNHLVEIARVHHSVADQDFSRNCAIFDEDQTSLEQTISTIYRSSCNITRVEELMKKFIYGKNIPCKISLTDCSHMLYEIESLNNHLSSLYNMCIKKIKKEE